MLQSFVFNLFLISELNLVCNYVFVGLVHRRARLPRSLEEVWQTPFLRLVQFIENVWKGASCPLISAPHPSALLGDKNRKSGNTFIYISFESLFFLFLFFFLVPWPGSQLDYRIHRTDLQYKNFTKDIIVFLLSILIWTYRKGKTKLYFLPVGRNRILSSRKQKCSWYNSCFLVLLFCKSVLRKCF